MPQTSSSPRCPQAAPPRGTQHKAFCARTHSTCKHRAREAHVQAAAGPCKAGQRRAGTAATTSPPCSPVPSATPVATPHLPHGRAVAPAPRGAGARLLTQYFVALLREDVLGQNLTDPDSCCSALNCPHSVGRSRAAAQEAAKGNCERSARLTQPAGMGCATGLRRNCGKTEKELLTLKTRTGKTRGGRKAQALERPERVSARNEEVYEL